jgi:hypothetical protein
MKGNTMPFPFLVKKEIENISWCMDALPPNFSVLLTTVEAGPIPIQLQNIYAIEDTYSYKWYYFSCRVKNGCKIFLRNAVPDSQRHLRLDTLTSKLDKQYVMEYIYELMDIARDYAPRPL